jgi:predicted short-subunit dehydrogenase-like oxidoreductase (DUF2520 family)
VKFNIIGAGRLGKQLALSLITHTQHELIAICNRDKPSAQRAIDLLGAGHAVARLADLPAVDLTLITVPDDHITNIALELAKKQVIKLGSIVAHCSGALSSDCLTPLRNMGILVASIHPLQAFPAHQLAPDALNNCCFAIEGDQKAVDVLSLILTALGSQLLPIHPLKKTIYHAAAVMASNYLITLASMAEELFIESGLSQYNARKITHQLMQNNLNHLLHSNTTQEALTGPLARGDKTTIKQHLQAIKTPHIAKLYRAAGLATLPLTDLSQDKCQAIKRLLDESK